MLALRGLSMGTTTGDQVSNLGAPQTRAPRCTFWLAHNRCLTPLDYVAEKTKHRIVLTPDLSNYSLTFKGKCKQRCAGLSERISKIEKEQERRGSTSLYFRGLSLACARILILHSRQLLKRYMHLAGRTSILPGCSYDESVSEDLISIR